VEDPTPVAVMVDACGDDHARFRWHLTDGIGMSVRVSPESYPSAEEASAAGEAALAAFGAAVGT